MGPSIKDVRSKLGLFDPLPPCPSYDVTVTTRVSLLCPLLAETPLPLPWTSFMDAPLPVDQVGQEAYPDISLPTHDDGAVDRRHEGNVDQWQEVGGNVWEDGLSVGLPQTGQGVEHQAQSYNLEKAKNKYFVNYLSSFV